MYPPKTLKVEKWLNNFQAIISWIHVLNSGHLCIEGFLRTELKSEVLKVSLSYLLWKVISEHVGQKVP